MKYYEIKNTYGGDFEIIKDFDFKSRTVTGYFSRFGNKDHDGDILMPGAFSKSIEQRGQGSKNLIPHLADHMMTTGNLLSKPKLYEKADGGFFESTITDTTKGIDILKQYRDGLINQHSFGFKILRSDDKKEAREIKEVLLYEISTVPLGANEEATFTGFKSLTKPQLIERYSLLTKCYKDGDYSDEFFEVLKFQLKQVEADLLDLFIKQENNDTKTTAPLASTNTQPEVDVALNNIFKRLNVLDDGTGTLKKIGEICGKL